jgi:hypothetical protein
LDVQEVVSTLGRIAANRHGLDAEARRLFPGIYPPWDKRAIDPP